eukprot:12418060-Karenia_brevis.AAC.1
MRGEYGWGDMLTLKAMADILQRPIQIVNNNVLNADGHTIEPPDSLPKKFWGPPIIIAHYGQLHFEATEELPGQPDIIEDID